MERFKNIDWMSNIGCRVLSVLIFSLVLCGCGNRYQYIPKDIEPVTVDIVRFDSALLAVRADSTMQDVRRLYAEYEAFIPLYVEGVLRLPMEDTAYFSEQLANFLVDTAMGLAQTNALAKERFANIDSIQNALNIAFSRLHYLYPDWVIPTVYLFVSGFNSSVVYYDNMLGVGVDMYLGSDYPYYNQVVYDYQKSIMEKEYVVRDLMSMYLAYNIAYNSKYNRLLEQMIFRGKQLFLLSQLLPDAPAWQVIGYTPEQWAWCEHYEQAIWNRIMEKRDLFKTESRILNSYMNEGPFTAEVTQDSPGRLGLWVGWRIVDSYMRHNEEVSIHDLINEGDAQKILEQSFYKP
ncbi:MAG: hypothetical protein IJX60_03110 [Paludibacteraceae bacterium]|nr:hypothetical protein [Paludibacteraceae bacterium]